MWPPSLHILAGSARMGPWMRYVVLICCVILLFVQDASSLSTIDSDGVIFAFPQGQEKIVSRMASQVPSMMSFLTGKGLPVKTPVYVFLDEDLDLPDAVVHMIPHREIRIPLKAPGVLEEGYLEDDPWTYFLFKGLSLQGIYSVRSGIPGAVHHVFGEIVSPNLINPPWLLAGIHSLLYHEYRKGSLQDPYKQAILSLPAPADISQISNHPEAWPGYFGYTIYGQPFLSWLQQRYGWDAILLFIQVHGSGILPIEIDLKAKDVFGKRWPALWASFIQDSGLPKRGDAMAPITGYISNPRITWDHSGISPGPKRTRIRGRYGHLTEDDTLWISEYDRDGMSHLVGYTLTGSSISLGMDHLWDPGPGGVAVTRIGGRPSLVILEKSTGIIRAKAKQTHLIPAPEGIIQFSGPVMDGKGRIAVAANTGGNWDIWLYDGSWQRITKEESIEMDPWWAGETLVFSSNVSGTFQIHRSDFSQLTRCSKGAFLPRDRTCLCLTDHGWSIEDYVPGHSLLAAKEALPLVSEENITLQSRPYTPWQSIYPDFVTPDLYVGIDDVEFGLATWGRDVSGDYSLNAGVRYSVAYDYLALRAGTQLHEVGAQVTRYPFICKPQLTPTIEESRMEYRISFQPETASWFEASLHALDYERLEGESGPEGVDLYASLGFHKRYEGFSIQTTLEAYSGGSKSLFGGFRWILGTDIYAVIHGEAGKTWDGYTPGHGTYRVGGDVGEGYFTSRPSRLFPIRGYAPNILEAGKAATSGLEVFWPFVNIQKGYKTMPIFFHRLWLGTFIDAGASSDSMSLDDTLVGAGFELVTSLEVAWGNLSHFRVGISWPVAQPEYLSEKGPLLILQIGRPL